MATGLNTAALTLQAQAVQAVATHAQLYTAEPDATGATNASSAPRQPITWAAATDDMTVSVDIVFTGGEASGPCTHVGLWSDVSAGTFYGYFALADDVVFKSDGTYTVTSGLIDGSSA